MVGVMGGWREEGRLSGPLSPLGRPEVPAAIEAIHCQMALAR